MGNEIEKAKHRARHKIAGVKILPDSYIIATGNSDNVLPSARIREYTDKELARGTATVVTVSENTAIIVDREAVRPTVSNEVSVKTSRYGILPHRDKQRYG